MPSARRSSQAATASSSADATKSKDKPTTTTPASLAEAGPSKTATTNITASSSTNQPNPKEEASTDAHLELLTEHFGYNPKSFIDALVYLSNEHLYSIATEFENVVVELLKDVDGGELEAEQGIHAILTLMENSLDHTLDTFELYCFRSVFGIRSRQAKYMTLDHHRGLDLRNQQQQQQQQSAPSSSKQQSKPARKSLVGSTPTPNLSANQRSYQLGESEDSLKRQIAAARATQHKLLQAQNASRQSLDRTLQLAERFSSILYSDLPSTTAEAKSAAPVLTETLGQHARKLRADTIPLLKALGELRAADPLGAPLYSGTGSVERDGGDGEAEDDGGMGTRAWERGRENYLNWEADRIIAKSKRGATGAAGSTATATTERVEDAQADATQPAGEDDSKTPKRKRTAAAANAPTSSKRRTPGTASRTRS
ncbi:related to MTW1 - component of the MIND kinetochore complex [Ustilago trichophora]|uniref:Related to MTW1 - component of the MIND kinetochore complex n=1 Tax=Ustilago trichophora TaxID=86804 RepID=A0A5C3EBB3_9BASI|nr:related to MTW1 - component of the MIND kinetochore complex [Ustilago trichophora]